MRTSTALRYHRSAHSTPYKASRDHYDHYDQHNPHDPHDSIMTHPRTGFSSFKFVPGSNDSEIIALKTQEYEGEIATFIAVFSLSGKTLLDITLIGTIQPSRPCCLCCLVSCKVLILHDMWMKIRISTDHQ